MSEIALRVEGLSKRFGELRAVNDLSFTVEQGEVFGFLGPNGAGKTTSIRMIAGLLKQDAGKVLYRDKALTGAEGRSRIGLCPQELIFWENLSCLENLVFLAGMYGIAKRRAREEADRLLSLLALEEKRHSLARKLSGGMQRRLNLSLSLIHDPEILILDEPEAGLDPQSRVLVREFIRSLAGTKTLILTTHDMDEAERLADRIAIIDGGKLLAIGSAEELKGRAGSGERVEISYVGPQAASLCEKARDILSTHGFSQSEAIREADQIAIHVNDASSTLPSILEILKVELKPQSISVKRMSLEDLFIALTGRRIRG